jgi:predicted nucleotide-binding protein
LNTDDVLKRLQGAGLQFTERRRLTNGTGDQLRFQAGEIVNVFDKGSISTQGKNQDRVRELLGLGEPASERGGLGSGSRLVFVVYGHDTHAKAELEAMLRRWDLEPVILDQLPSEGQTIIEKLEKYATSDVGFAVVLATPDDQGHPRAKPDEAHFRARQNVVLELGLLLAKLGRSKVAILLKDQENMERPTDIQGVIYIPFNDSVEEAKVLLAKEMEKQGITLKVSKL